MKRLMKIKNYKVLLTALLLLAGSAVLLAADAAPAAAPAAAAVAPAAAPAAAAIAQSLVGKSKRSLRCW